MGFWPCVIIIIICHVIIGYDTYLFARVKYLYGITTIGALEFRVVSFLHVSDCMDGSNFQQGKLARKIYFYDK